MHTHIPTYPSTRTQIPQQYFLLILQCYYFTYPASHCAVLLLSKVFLKTTKYLASRCISSHNPLLPSHFLLIFMKWDTAPADLSSIFCQRSQKQWRGSHRAVQRQQLCSACHNFGESSKPVMAMLFRSACYEIDIVQDVLQVTGTCVNYWTRNAADDLFFQWTFHSCILKYKTLQRRNDKQLLYMMCLWCSAGCGAAVNLFLEDKNGVS